VVYKLRPEIFTPGTTPDILGVLALGNFRVIMWANTAAPPSTGGKKSRKKK
jgi:hypothetical protein